MFPASHDQTLITHYTQITHCSAFCCALKQFFTTDIAQSRSSAWHPENVSTYSVFSWGNQ